MSGYCLGRRFLTRGSTRSARSGLTTNFGKATPGRASHSQRNASTKLIRSTATPWRRDPRTAWPQPSQGFLKAVAIPGRPGAARGLDELIPPHMSPDEQNENPPPPAGDGEATENTNRRVYLQVIQKFLEIPAIMNPK